jgi:TRAP-type C4-dicarboxylate transport system permease small subunit
VSRALDWLSAFTEWTIGAMMAALVVTGVSQVYFRYFTSSSLDWSEELARYLFVWIVFLTSAVAIRRRAHIVVDVLVIRLPPRVQKGVAIATAALTLVFLGFMTVYGASLVRIAWAQTTPGLGISRGCVFLSVPIGFALMFVNLLPLILNLLIRRSGVVSAFTGPDLAV